MPDKDLLPPPPKKNKNQVNTDGIDLLPPPPKKKGLSGGGEQPKDYVSVPQSTSKNEFEPANPLAPLPKKTAVESLAERINATVTPNAKSSSSNVFGSRKEKPKKKLPESFTKIVPDEVVYNTNVLDRQQRKLFNQLSPNAGMTENPELVKAVLEESNRPEVKRRMAIDYLNEEAAKDGVDINAVDIPSYIKDKRQAVQQQVVSLINEAGKKLENVDRDVDITNIDLVVERNPEIKQKLDEVKRLDNYLVELTKYADDVNAKRAFEANPTDYKAIGRKRRKLNDYTNVQRKELSIQRGTENEKNKDLRETEDYNDELLGLQTAANEIQQKVASGEMREDEATPLLENIHEQNRTLEKRYPSVALDNLRVYLGDKLAEKRKANDGAGMTTWNAIVSAAPSESELKKLIEEAKKDNIEITPEQEQQLLASKNKIPALSILGHGYKSLILAPSMALNNWVGNGELNIEKEKEYRDPSMYMAEQPQGIAAPEQLGASDKKVVRVVNNPEAGKKANWNSRATLNNIAEIAGVVTSYALLNKGFGAVAEKALGGIAGAETVGYANGLKPKKALSEAQRNIASNIGSSVFLNYHNQVNLMSRYTDDKNAQKAYGMASSLVTGLLFSELNPNKIFTASERASKNAAEKFIQEFKAGKGVLEPEKFKQWAVNYIENISKDLGHNVSIIKANQIADIALQGLTEKSSLKGRNLDEEVLGNIPSEIIALAPISAIAGYKKTNSEVGLRNAVRMAIADPVHFEEGMAIMVEQGKITPQEAQEKIGYIKQLVKTTNSADLKTERVSSLPEDKKFEYAANITKESNLKERAKGLSDKLQVDEHNKQIEQLQGERKIMLLKHELGDKNYRDLTDEEKAQIELPKGYVTVKSQPVQSEESDNHVPVLVNSKGEHEIIKKSFKTADEAKVYGEDVAKERYFNENISNKQQLEQIETAEDLLRPYENHGMFMGMTTPEQKLKFIADQAQGVMQDGSISELGGQRSAMDKAFGSELVDAAIEKYPAKKETSVTVEPPLQQPEPITIGANGIYVETKRTELSFKGLQEIATQFGYNDITSRERKSDLKLFNDAKETIQKWMDEGIYSKKIEETVNKITHTDEERVILENHLHSMRMEADEAAAKFGVNSRDFKKLSSELDDFVFKMKAARSEQAAGLRIPSTTNMNTASIADAINAYKASQNGADLTEKQTEEVAKDYDNIKQAKEKAETVFKDANAKFEEMKAENELLKQQLAAKKSKTNKVYTKDGKRDYKSERNSLKEQLKKQAQEFIDESKKLGISDDGGAKQFLMSAKIAKTVLEIAKSHAEEVGARLSEVVKKTLDDVKDFISGISEEDIRDVISGKYSENKYTRNEITAIMRELKTEQQLLNEYERLLSGGEPKEEKKKIQRNERLQALRDKIKSFSSDKGEPTDEMIKKAKDAISRNKAKEQKFLDKLKNEDYEKEKSPQSIYDSPEFKKKYPDLYKDLLDSRQKAHEAQLEFEKKLVQNGMKNATTFDKFKQVLLKSRGTLKAIFAGIDDSAVGVQNWMMALTNPHIGGQSIKNHFLDFWSQSRFDRYIQELHNSSDWNIMKESGLRVSEPKSLLEEGRDEMFPQRFKAIIKIKGKEYGYVNIGGKKYELFDVLKPFERAFTSLGNSLRVIKFRTDAEKLYEKGYTFENNPDAFKKLAIRINNMTSAPEINPKFQSDLLNVAIWSPRLLTSKLNILGISDIASVTPLVDKGYYRSLGTKGKILSKEQMYAVADLAKFAAAVMAISYGYAAARGGTVNTDPTSNGYLDVELPNGKSYNFSGGFSKYISLISQLAKGGKTNKLGVFKPYEKTMTDRATEVAHFLRGKMPPISGSIVNLATGSDYTGKKTDFATEAERYKMPMAIGQIYDQVQKDGYSSLFIDGIPTFLGINIKDSRDYTSHDFKEETKKFISKHQLDVTYPSKTYTKHGEKIKMTDDEYKAFLKDTDKAIEDEIEDLKKNGDYVIRNGKLSDGKIPYVSLKDKEIADILKKRISDRIAKIRVATFKTDEKTEDDYIREANQEILQSLRRADKNQ